MRVALERRLAEALPDAKTGAPPSIPDHTLLRPIGSGAYGEVWLALSALGTLRAVKIVYRARFKEDRPYEREFNGILKYEPVSRTHEGLTQVLHVGRNDERGYFYYVMELADDAVGSDTRRRASDSAIPNPNPESFRGKPEIRNESEPSDVGRYSPRTLRSDLARGQRLLPGDAAQFVLRLASALGHLHTHGLVHRDIKPSNIIFVAGQPKLADIGLVTDVGSSHSFVGTEGFIPPEGPGTPRADLYGLGKLLYELATGRDRMDFPQLPAGVARLRDGEALLELNEVMTRACAPDPQQRYATATEMQAELNLFLAGRSLRRARYLERHLARLKRFAVAGCGFLVSAAVVAWFAKNEERHASEREQQANERARAESTLRSRAETAERGARQQLYTALLGEARATVRSGELGHRVRALDALRRAAAISNTVELRREVFAALALPDLRFERELPTGSEVTLMQLNAGFDRYALCRGHGPVEIRSASDRRLLVSLPASANLPAHFGTWSPDSRFLAIKRDRDAAGRAADLEVWEVASARRVLLLRDVPWGVVSFHPHRPQMIAGLFSGTVAVWNLEDGSELVRFTLPTSPLQLKYSPDGRRFAVSYDREGGGVVWVHRATDGVPLASQAIPRGVSAIDWHPSGRWIAAGGDDGSVHLIDSRTGESRTLGRHKANAVWMAFSPDGGYLVSGGWERELICWDLQAMRCAFAMALGSFRLEFRADGGECAVFTEPAVKVHTFERPINYREFVEDLGARLTWAAFSPDGRWLAASADEGLGVWDLSGRGPGALATEGAEARPFFTLDGGELFGSRNQDECFRWRVLPGTNSEAAPQLQRLDLHKPEGFTSLCLISNTVVMTGGRGSRVVSRDNLAAGEERWVRTSPGISGASPDGRWLGIYGAFTPSLYVYRLPGLEHVAKLTQPANIGAFKFSPLGDEVAIASRGRVEIWNTTTWERTRVLSNFRRLLYAPDGRTCWLDVDFLTAGLYDARSFEPLLLLPRGILPLAFSPDGRYLAVSVDTRRLQVWDLAQLREQFRKLGMDWGSTDN